MMKDILLISDYQHGNYSPLWPLLILTGGDSSDFHSMTSYNKIYNYIQ